LPERGSWIVGKMPLPHGRMDWQPFSAPLERCAQNVMLVTFNLRLSRSRQLTDLNRTLEER
jgi:hypothetical protein